MVGGFVNERMMREHVDLRIPARLSDPGCSVFPIAGALAYIESRHKLRFRRSPGLPYRRLLHFQLDAGFVFEIPSSPID